MSLEERKKEKKKKNATSTLDKCLSMLETQLSRQRIQTSLGGCYTVRLIAPRTVTGACARRTRALRGKWTDFEDIPGRTRGRKSSGKILGIDNVYLVGPGAARRHGLPRTTSRAPRPESETERGIFMKSDRFGNE